VKKSIEMTISSVFIDIFVNCNLRSRYIRVMGRIMWICGWEIPLNDKLPLLTLPPPPPPFPAANVEIAVNMPILHLTKPNPRVLL
jgi:hypothetical protein